MVWMKDGILTKGSPPKNESKGPRIITHRSQKTIVVSSGRRLDALLQGKARICIKRSLGGLGDIIMATPIARGAKKKYPNSHVTYAVPTEYAGGDLVALLQYIPYIDEVVDFKLINRDDYDVFTDITRVGLSQEKPHTIPPNRIDMFASAAGIPLFGNFLPIYIMTEEERLWGKEFVQKITRKKEYKGLLSIHLGSRDPKRSWPHFRIREFVKLAKEAGYFCFLFEWGATSSEWKLAGSTQVFDYRLRQAAAILAATDLLVCPDSMMLHLGGALNIKTVSLFGSMPPACRINHYPNAIAVINKEISCLGCIYQSCSNDYYCMKSILPQAVLAACEKKLEGDVINHIDSNFNESVYPAVFTEKVMKRIQTFSL